MKAATEQHTYEAKIKIGDEVISKTTGDSISDLQVFLIGQCEMEKSGAEGEIVEIGTGEVVYRCRKQYE
ncbi:hypothetical protein [Legionella maioricensis]|uniref:Uncharacterized protein n=1 Tax=Legionella maioricensis TaxID=2896528 RepID=A0A9X2D2C7_9GAMM|nr:hypothetical protein [Legionella maioricensis]MCL9684948.1 hypothetical protein [Legionella maioricensis]MCL9688220.1 hypothetical protein [Legionella maioricensis]